MAVQSSLRPRARSSAPFSSRFMGGIRQLGQNISSAPSRIARDFRHATGMERFTGAAEEDYDRRTQESLARVSQPIRSTGSGRGAELTDAIQGAGLNPNQFREMNEAQKNFIMMTNPRLKQAFSRHPDSQGHNFEVMPSGFGSGDTGGGGDTGDGDTGGGGTQTNQALMNRMRMQQEQDARARNMEIARMMFERQNMMSPGPVPRQMQGIAAFRRQPPPGMSERMMREQPTQYGGQAQQVSQANFAGDQQMQPPPEEMPPGFGGQGVQPAVMPPEEMAPGFGGQGVQPAVMPRFPNPRMPQFPNPRMPRYPQPMPYNPASSPAFRYAAQNYGRLGGMQRTMPRPMEMMSQRERQQIGTIADSFQPQPMQNPYVGILQRGLSAKGGGRSGSQVMPSFMPRGFGGSMGRGMF